MSKEAEQIIQAFGELPESMEKYILLGQIKSLIEQEKEAKKSRREQKEDGR